MTIETMQLKTGEQLVIKTMHPPLLDYASKVGCWGDIREELLGGELTESLFTPYFVGEIDGEVVGSMSYYTPTDTRDVGVVEFVQTAEAHRGKGVASTLMVVPCVVAQTVCATLWKFLVLLLLTMFAASVNIAIKSTREEHPDFFTPYNRSSV